jgi:hypothetical protein
MTETTKQITITKKDPRFDNLRYVCDAASSDHTRPFLNTVHVETREDDSMLGAVQVMVATDGRRIHVAPAADIFPADGDYEITENKRTYVVLTNKTGRDTFPHWQKVMPSQRADDFSFGPRGEIDLDVKRRDYSQALSIALYRITRDSQRAYDIDYIKALSNDRYWSYQVAKSKHDRDPGYTQAEITTADRLAVIAAINEH